MHYVFLCIAIFLKLDGLLRINKILLIQICAYHQSLNECLPVSHDADEYSRHPRFSLLKIQRCTLFPLRCQSIIPEGPCGYDHSNVEFRYRELLSS